MSLRDQSKDIIEYAQDQKYHLSHNGKLFNIYEGDLLTYVLQDLREQLSEQSYEQAKGRVAPINILRKIIDRLSKIYQQVVVREVVDGSDSDKDLLAWYEANMQANFKLNVYNEFYNLFKNSLIQPYVLDGKPNLRIIPSDRFIPYSDNVIDPTKPTHIIIEQGCFKDHMGTNKTIYQVWSDEEFLVITSDGEILSNEMVNVMGDSEGVNPYGRLPFTYVNQSNNLLMPKIDTDMLSLTKLIPILLTDLNFAVLFQSFSIMYGVDVDDKNLKMAPNSFWQFKSDPNSDKKPEIGSIKPQVDIDQVLGLIQSELAFWLNSKGIRPGSVGTLTSDSFSSGISKMMDEMDTVEERRKQVEVFRAAEYDLWDLIMHSMHPVWLDSGLIENNAVFTPTAKVVVRFPEQLPMTNRKDLIDELKLEVESGFTSKKKAIKTLNPKLSDEEINEHLAEIDEEKAITVVGE